MSDDFLIVETAHLSVAVADAAAEPTDPAELRLMLLPPGGIVQTYDYGADVEIVRDGVGAFHADVTLDTAGAWYWRWETSLPHVGADEGALRVRRGRFAA